MKAVPVLIVGGGPVGLTASILLSQAGVRSLLVERHAGQQFIPRREQSTRAPWKSIDSAASKPLSVQQGFRSNTPVWSSGLALLPARKSSAGFPGEPARRLRRLAPFGIASALKMILSRYYGPLQNGML